MKKIFAVFCVTCLSFASSRADTLAQWTFETSPPADITDNTTISGIAADTGTGTASGIHASSLTDWSTPTGNGSANSISANNWAIGDYYQFSTVTTGYEDIFLGWAQTSSTTGPGEFKLAYQVNGGGFTDFTDYTVLPNSATAPGVGTWSSSTENTGYNFSINLSAITSLDNAASVDFRLIMRTDNDSTPPGTVAVAGTSRIDNFTVTATPVPEPSVFALAGLGGLALLAYRRRR